MKAWLPEEIKQLRKDIAMSQTAFADELGVTRNFIYYLERGERTPNKTLQLLLDCKEKDFNNGKGKGAVHGKKRNVSTR